MPNINGNKFLEVHVSDSFLSFWSKNNLNYQLMEMAEDGSVTLQASGSLGIKGQYPRQALVDQKNFIFFTDMSGHINFVTAEQVGEKIVFSEPKYLEAAGEKI